jgi:hypothetical protein
MTIGRARFGAFQLTGRPPSERSHRPVAKGVAIHAQQDGAQHLLGQRTQRGALPADRAPGDHQPDDADHEEQRG